MISELIDVCGGRNIFEELAQVAPPVGVEAVIERNPQVIITADGAQGDPLAVCAAGQLCALSVKAISIR